MNIMLKNVNKIAEAKNSRIKREYVSIVQDHISKEMEAQSWRWERDGSIELYVPYLDKELDKLLVEEREDQKVFAEELILEEITDNFIPQHGWELVLDKKQGMILLNKNHPNNIEELPDPDLE